ncbi:SGNH/GDSL hydrolase family protein [Amnibacterium setariae]|uniref:SGNH/GDSL hydrolase family protein n=1 Tax=Amnibacterium setariae TaxID=2306585 RepID=A0A3A1TSN8_9MICO|nr:SGNH/GDSL hydrolase family protein [Amnibacterium setariae]
MRRGRRVALVVLVVVVALIAVAAAAGAVIKTRDDARAAQRSAAEYTPPPLTDPTPAARPIVAVVGDDSTSAAGPGVSQSERWTARVAAQQDVDVQTFASAGSSYLSKGSDGRTLAAQAARVPRNAAVVFVFGGARDATATPLRVSRAASQTISTVQARAPQAVVVLVGPVLSGGTDALTVADLRTNLQNVAGAFQIRFVDPVQQAWLNSTPSSGSRLTESDEQVLAARFGTIVAQLLPAN